MKLTNEQKAYNSTVRAGVEVMSNKINELHMKLLTSQGVIKANRHLLDESELSKAKCLVEEHNIKLLKGRIKQLEKCVEILVVTEF